MALIQKFQIPVSDRSSYNSYLWDGKTLALNFQREIWDEDCDVLLKVCDPEPFDDFTIAHEIAHYVVADPIEREFPEWASFIGIEPRANGGLKWDNLEYNSAEYKRQVSFQEGLLTLDEQNFREACADFLAVHWCDMFGIKVEDAARPIFKYSNNPAFYEFGWKAIIWLREKGLM